MQKKIKKKKKELLRKGRIRLLCVLHSDDCQNNTIKELGHSCSFSFCRSLIRFFFFEPTDLVFIIVAVFF